MEILSTIGLDFEVPLWNYTHNNKGFSLAKIKTISQIHA